MLAALFALVVAAPTLDIYWIDAEGGASTLIVSPQGESLLIDTANRRPDDRDAKRIMSVAHQAGLQKIDRVLTTHYHGDHLGSLEALAKLIPIGQFIDHGESVELDRARGAAAYRGYQEVTRGKRRIVKPGDTIPLAGALVTVVAAGGKVIDRPLPGGVSNEALCKEAVTKAPDADPENNESVGVVLSYGKFRFLDLGDLPWQREQPLVCPVNRIGPIDLYQTTHHGLDRSGSPQVVWAIKPKVVVMNNGPTKGGPPSTFETLRKSPGLEDIWQGHLALGTPRETNTREEMIANVEPSESCRGHWLKAAVSANGKYTLTNSRNGFKKTYAAR